MKREDIWWSVFIIFCAAIVGLAFYMNLHDHNERVYINYLYIDDDAEYHLSYTKESGEIIAVSSLTQTSKLHIIRTKSAEGFADLRYNKHGEVYSYFICIAYDYEIKLIND